MPYDEDLAARVRRVMARRKNAAEKKMFGGVGFLLGGHMCVGVWKQFLIVRVGPDGYEGALRETFVRKFDITGRAMTGWVMVDPGGLETDDTLRRWIRQATAFVSSLPPKT